jgi:hypothetical protein
MSRTARPLTLGTGCSGGGDPFGKLKMETAADNSGKIPAAALRTGLRRRAAAAHDGPGSGGNRTCSVENSRCFRVISTTSAALSAGTLLRRQPPSPVISTGVCLLHLDHRAKLRPSAGGDMQAHAVERSPRSMFIWPKAVSPPAAGLLRKRSRNGVGSRSTSAEPVPSAPLGTSSEQRRRAPGTLWVRLSSARDDTSWRPVSPFGGAPRRMNTRFSGGVARGHRQWRG